MEGKDEGDSLGRLLGCELGDVLGKSDGASDGKLLGCELGDSDGLELGWAEGKVEMEGELDGDAWGIVL